MYGKGQLRQKSVYIYLFNLHVHAIEHKKCEITQIPQRTKIHTSLITYHMYIYIYKRCYSEVIAIYEKICALGQSRLESQLEIFNPGLKIL